MKHLKLFIISYLFIVYGCNSQSPDRTYSLTNQEKHYCDSMKIDTEVILLIRTKTDSVLVPFPKRLDFVLDADFDSTEVHNSGFLFNSLNRQTENIVASLYKPLKDKGYTIFTLDQNSGIENRPDIIAVLHTVDKYQILRQVQTNGINWEIDNDSLINIIKKFDDKYSLELVGAGDDWCEFKINNDVKNWMALAKEAYKVCPDIVEQGSGTVPKLSEEMKRTKKLYFWWD
jgi:hypothetical protein